MTREDLVRLIYFSDYCPEYNCQPTTRDQCQECCSKALTEYENQIRAVVIDECITELEEDYKRQSENVKYPDYDYYCNGMADCIDYLEQLKEKKNDKIL